MITLASSITVVAHSAHDYGHGRGNLSPSPTESVGCVAHGSHWDCEGPASTGSIISSAVASATAAAGNATRNATISSASPVVTGAAVTNCVRLGFTAGLVGVVAMFAL
ncbi:hypothetical protein BDD12DRAFT_90875 [Trichophaea hybrida]|nr:hypothetical protein BDD12DRAFT_90875 [Trichophaea hybrida]